MTLAEANHVLRLSDSQLAIVRQAAVPLSPSARDRYLKTVAAELAEAERVDDAIAPLARWGTAKRSGATQELSEPVTRCGIEIGSRSLPTRHSNSLRCVFSG